MSTLTLYPETEALLETVLTPSRQTRCECLNQVLQWFARQGWDIRPYLTMPEHCSIVPEPTEIRIGGRLYKLTDVGPDRLAFDPHEVRYLEELGNEIDADFAGVELGGKATSRPGRVGRNEADASEPEATDAEPAGLDLLEYEVKALWIEFEALLDKCDLESSWQLLDELRCQLETELNEDDDPHVKAKRGRKPPASLSTIFVPERRRRMDELKSRVVELLSQCEDEFAEDLLEELCEQTRALAADGDSWSRSRRS